MKKNFVKLGALAVAVTLALVFAACAQPTDESAGAGTPTIIRLYLDKQAEALVTADATVKLTVGTLDAELLALNQFRWVNGGKTAYTLDSFSGLDPLDTLYLESATIKLTMLDPTAPTVGNVTVDVEDGKGYYVDIELVDLTFDSLDFGKIYSGSDSFYIKCTTDDGPINGAQDGDYYYTPDHLTRDSDPVFAPQTNDYIQTVDLSPGINELHFKYFN